MALTLFMFGQARAKYLLLAFVGVGGWLIGPALMLVSFRKLLGHPPALVRLLRNRSIIAVVGMSVFAEGILGIFGDRAGAGGLLVGILSGSLAAMLGTWGYGLLAFVGGILLYVTMVGPIVAGRKLPLPDINGIREVFSSVHAVNNNVGGKPDKPGSDASLHPDSQEINAVDEEPVLKSAVPSATKGAPSSLAIGNNEELAYEVLSAPHADQPLSLSFLPDPPELAQTVIDDAALKQLQVRIEEAAFRLAKLHLESARDPVVGMTNIRFAFSKVAGQSVSARKAVTLSEDLSVETGRGPIRIYIDSTINFELPLSAEERRYAPIKPLLREMPEPDLESQDIRYLIGRHQDGRVFDLSAHSALHMLVGGATGGGKSVLLHSIIWGLIFRYPPSRVRLALYDHKIEEFAPYSELPHLWQPIVTNEGGYYRLIDNLKSEITSRKLARRDNPDAQFVWLIVILDEFRGLSNDTFVALIAEARSLQIRFILGTQRAEKSFISTSIKANLPTGISFRVRNQMESRLIIGEPDACNLLPHGDCIVHSPSGLERIQAGWVQKDDLKALRQYLSSLK